MNPADSAGLWSVLRLSPCVARVATPSLPGTTGKLGNLRRAGDLAVARGDPRGCGVYSLVQLAKVRDRKRGRIRLRDRKTEQKPH